MGYFEEQNHGQGQGNQQRNQETSGKDPKGKEGRKASQETRVRQHSDRRTLRQTHRHFDALFHIAHVELEAGGDFVFDDHLKLPMSGGFI